MCIFSFLLHIRKKRPCQNSENTKTTVSEKALLFRKKHVQGQAWWRVNSESWGCHGLLFRISRASVWGLMGLETFFIKLWEVGTCQGGLQIVVLARKRVHTGALLDQSLSGEDRSFSA